MITWLLAPAAVLLFAIFAAPRLARRMLLIAGTVCIAIGVAAAAYLEWQYAPERTTLVSLPVSLAAPGEIRAPERTALITGPYEIWIAFDHRDDGENTLCLFGEPGFEASCPQADPKLDLSWAIEEDGIEKSGGHTDWSAWHARQAEIAAAAARGKIDNPYGLIDIVSGSLPLNFDAARFDAVAGHRYAITLRNLAPAGRLAQRHPRLIVGLSHDATRSVGRMLVFFALLWIVAGAIFFLRTIRRGTPP